MIDITALESFTKIPTVNSIEIEAQSSKGKQFKSQKYYYIKGRNFKNGQRMYNIFI